MLSLSEDGATGIETPPLTPPLEGAGNEIGASPRGGLEGVWYTLDGRRLSDKPAQKGIYVHQGRKEVVR